MSATAEVQKRPPRRLPGLPAHIQEYLLCILFHLLLPFLPILIERVVSTGVSQQTILLFLAVYPLSIGVSSRSRLLFGITVIIGIIYAVLFGLAVGKIQLSPVTIQVGYGCLVAVMLIHSCERYNRHVAERQPFWEFG